MKSRKPLIWRPTCVQLSSLVDSLAQITPQLEDIKDNSTIFEHFATLRTKYVTTASTMEDAKTRAATFAKKADISSYETRKLDPESLAIQARLRVDVRKVEASMQSLADHLENLETSATSSRLYEPDTRQPLSLVNPSSPNTVDVSLLFAPHLY